MALDIKSRFRHCMSRRLHGGCSSGGRVPDCGSGCRGFKSHHPPEPESSPDGGIGTVPFTSAFVAQLDRATDFESVGRRFDSCRTQFSVFLGPLAQLAEQQTLNLRVAGSKPARLTIFGAFAMRVFSACLLSALDIAVVVPLRCAPCARVVEWQTR